MNKTIIDIEITHKRILNEFITTMMTNEAVDKTSDVPTFQLIGPARYSNIYTAKVADDISLTRTAMKSVNKRTYDNCKDILNKVNPVGLDVPRVDTKSDEEIDKSYKELQTVILDKFNEASSVNENGEGWVKFVNTLATPLDKAANYIVPKFTSVYNQFTSQKLSKVTKADVMKAIEVLSNYDKDMELIEADAESAISKYNSRLCTLKTKNNTFSESMESLSEALYIIESDYISAQSCLVREKAINQSLINSYRILSALSSYNPRKIKETATDAEFISGTIADTIEEMTENADKYIRYISKTESDIKECIKEFTTNLMKNNTEFLNEYKERALKSNCIGISMKEWHVPVSIDSMINEAVRIAKNIFSVDNLKDKDINYISKLQTSVREVRNAVMGESYDNNIITSPAAKRIMELCPWKLPSSSTENWFFTTERYHMITKDDVVESVNILEGLVSDIESIQDDAINFKNYNGSDLVKEGEGHLSKKATMIRNIENYRDHIILAMEQQRINSKVAQLKIAHSKARAVLLSAARVFNEDAFVKERENFRAFSEQCDKLLVINK